MTPGDRARYPDLVGQGVFVSGGATGIGAGWGYHDAEDLLDAGAVAVAGLPGEVLSLVREHVDG